MPTIAAQLRSFCEATVFDGEDWAFWEVALSSIEQDTAHEIGDYEGRTIVMELGVCSHWLRALQTRWTADGGFAWPSGYMGGQWSRSGLPEFD